MYHDMIQWIYLVLGCLPIKYLNNNFFIKVKLSAKSSAGSTMVLQWQWKRNGHGSTATVAVNDKNSSKCLELPYVFVKTWYYHGHRNRPICFCCLGNGVVLPAYDLAECNLDVSILFSQSDSIASQEN